MWTGLCVCNLVSPVSNAGPQVLAKYPSFKYFRESYRESLKQVVLSTMAATLSRILPALPHCDFAFSHIKM